MSEPLLIFLSIHTIYFLYKYYIFHTLFKKVQLCSGYHYGFDFDTLIHNNPDIDPSCRLKKNEIDIAKNILNEFQKTLISSYFNESLNAKFLFMNMPDKDYFMYSFFEFLQKHSNSHFFNDLEILKFKSSNYTVDKYTITEEGLTYYKLYYISCYYCENSHYIQKRLVFTGSSDNILNVIRKRETEFIKY